MTKNRTIQIISVKKKQDTIFFSRLPESYSENKLCILKEKIAKYDLDNLFLIMNSKYSDDFDKLKFEVDKYLTGRELYLSDLFDITQNSSNIN